MFDRRRFKQHVVHRRLLLSLKDHAEFSAEKRPADVRSGELSRKSRGLTMRRWSDLILLLASVLEKRPDFMNSILTVTTAATDRALLTTAELRDAVGASLTDPQLETLGNRVAAAIARACGVAEGGTVPVTLRLETLTETFRARRLCRRHLMLSRRPVVAISSVMEDDTIVAASEYELDASAGLLNRLSSDKLADWPAVSKIVVVYRAGYETVPDDLAPRGDLGDQQRSRPHAEARTCRWCRRARVLGRSRRRLGSAGRHHGCAPSRRLRQRLGGIGERSDAVPRNVAMDDSGLARDK
jgi:hypothetical protein